MIYSSKPIWKGVLPNRILLAIRSMAGDRKESISDLIRIAWVEGVDDVIYFPNPLKSEYDHAVKVLTRYARLVESVHYNGSRIFP